MWMAFWVALGTLAAARASSGDAMRWFVLAGFFAGAAAGVKYTIVPVALVSYVLFAGR
jgi:hypothetical protein